LKTYSYQKSWDEIDALLILLKDRTSGKTTYAGGRVSEAHFQNGSVPNNLTIDLNRAYSFLCAHSSFYNCPLVLTHYIDTELNFGEKYPPLFSFAFEAIAAGETKVVRGSPNESVYK
jgi:uncharacterized protein (DUF1684 family)